MLDLLEGSASDGGPTVTIDVDVFKDNGAARRRRGAEQPLGGPPVELGGASRPRDGGPGAAQGAAPGVPARGQRRGGGREPDEPAAAARAAPEPRASPSRGGG